MQQGGDGERVRNSKLGKHGGSNTNLKNSGSKVVSETNMTAANWLFCNFRVQSAILHYILSPSPRQQSSSGEGALLRVQEEGGSFNGGGDAEEKTDEREGS